MQKHADGSPNLLAPEGPGSLGWQEFQAELKGGEQDPVSTKIKRSTNGAVTENGKTTIYKEDKYDYDNHVDLSKTTSILTRIATSEDRGQLRPGSPDFVMIVRFSDFEVVSGNADFGMKVGITGDAVLADRLHDQLFKALMLSRNPYGDLLKFVKVHDLLSRNLE